ncbi:MAG TPA: OmpH family outer membrane protein [Steroidobacteraceae bacterium]|nr:OmpH family outer membrane protein [Steroidobacteraceae bacterium]
MNLKSRMCILAGLGVLAAAPAWTAELKIAVVDFGRLMEDSPQYKVAQESIRSEFTPRQRELQNQQNTLKAKEDRLQKDGATMSEAQRQNADKELRDSYREFQRKQSELQDDFNARRNEEMSRLQKTLIEQVRTYAKSQNFDLVLADGVIYTTPTIDITPQVLAALQSHGSAAKPAGTSPAPAPAPKPQSH